MNNLVRIKQPRAAKKGARTAANFLPNKITLPNLRNAAKSCKGCDLWKNSTQTVFGEGSAKASILLVGEQPGDQEDRLGRPFVGPAGKLLDDALAEAGIDRDQVYVTNAVKHFKWAPDQRGKRRIHKKPRYSEIHACRPWLDAEVQMVKPRILLCLGATAAQSIFGSQFSVTRQRGQLVESALAPFAMATVHPSSILRAPNPEARVQQRRSFIDDLKKVAALVTKKQAA